MHLETKKLYLIEELLKVTDRSVLSQVELILANTKEPIKGNFEYFSGLMSKAEVDQFEKDIVEGCEQINPDDWK